MADAPRVELARYTLDDGKTEVSFVVDPEVGYVQAGSSKKAIGALRNAAAPAVAAAQTVLGMLEDARPDEAEVTFSLTASGTAHWFVGEAATGATFEVRLLWKKDGAGTAGRDAEPVS